MKKIFITVLAFGFVAGCSVFDSLGGSGQSLGGSAGSATGSSANSSGGSSANSSGGSSANSSGGSSGGFFGKKAEKETVLEQRIPAVDKRGLISVVNDVTVDKFRGGALVKVRGTTDSIGYSDVDLVAVNKGLPDKNGVVTFELKGLEPLKKSQGPTQRSNEVYAGASIPAVRMPSVKAIRIIAAQNQITVSN